MRVCNDPCGVRALLEVVHRVKSLVSFHRIPASTCLLGCGISVKLLLSQEFEAL